MKITLKKMTALAVAFAAMTFAAVAQDSGALVEALVKKGILTDQEAEEIRADLTKEFGQTPAGKLNLSSAVTQLKLYGDARVRYQWENKQDQTGTSTNHNADRNRYRYRVRLGAEYQLTDKFKTGIRLETATASDSTNANYGGYFDKTGDSVNLGLAYLQYEDTVSAPFGIADSFDVRLGKHQQPFMISQAWWDSDINPEGLSEKIGWKNVGFKGFDLTLIGGQYVISEENNSTATGTPSSGAEDAFLLAAQLQADYTFSNKSKLSIAPMVLTESSGTAFLAQENGGTLDNENSVTTIGNMTVVAIPAEYSWKMLGQSNKLFATYGYNFEGNRRLKDLSVNSATGTGQKKNGQNSFWNVGYEIGANKAKGDWKAGLEYRWIETGAYTSNLSDSDFAKNEFNQQGIVATAGYMFTDAVGFNATWMHSSDINDSIDVAVSDAATVDVLQLDVVWKF